MKRLSTRKPGADSKENEAEIADHLFPAAPVTNWEEVPSSFVWNFFNALDSETNESYLQLH